MLRVLLKITRGAFTVFVLGLCHPHSFNGRRLDAAEEAITSQADHHSAQMALEHSYVTSLGQTWHKGRYWLSPLKRLGPHRV